MQVRPGTVTQTVTQTRKYWSEGQGHIHGY